MATIETAPSTEVPPPLESGDHLTRAEFERRYHLMPRDVKAGRAYPSYDLDKRV